MLNKLSPFCCQPRNWKRKRYIITYFNIEVEWTNKTFLYVKIIYSVEHCCTITYIGLIKTFPFIPLQCLESSVKLRLVGVGVKIIMFCFESINIPRILELNIFYHVSLPPLHALSIVFMLLLENIWIFC